MTNDQLYLLACIFAARADAVNLSKILYATDNPKDIYDCASVLWPEYDNPSNLMLFLTGKTSNSLKPEELLVELLGNERKLVYAIELDSDAIQQRCKTVKTYVNSRLSSIRQERPFKFESIRCEWLRNRLIICDELKPEITDSYRFLWQQIENEDINFAKWVQGIIEPLVHINKRIGHCIKIREFEKMNELDVFSTILHEKNSKESTTIITRELVPYIENNCCYGSFLEGFFTTEFFSFESYQNCSLFKQLLTILNKSLPSPFKTNMQKKSLRIIFENSDNFIKVDTLTALRDTLQQIDDNTQVENYQDITAKSLKLYAKYMDKCMSGYNLKNIYAITQEEESAQMAHFASTIKNILSQVSLNSHMMDSVFDIINTPNTEDQVIFSHLSKEKQTFILVETALELGDFDLLHKFVMTYDSAVEEDVLLKYFWYYFNNASNGLSNRPEIVKARKTLELLLQADAKKFTYLEVLLELSNQLSQYSLNLGKGVPFKPSDILNYKSKPFDLIILLLELNSRLYKDSFTLTMLLSQLKSALSIENGDVTEADRTRILSLQIDHALVDMDLAFALENTESLLKLSDISQYWATIFQVGKFIDPNWKDDEIPTEILILQLQVMSKLLHVCPVEEVEVVTSHWSALELELTMRDFIHDPYSLENRDKTDYSASNALFRGVSSTLNSLLSGSQES